METFAARQSGGNHSIGNAQPLRVAPGNLPDLLYRPPYGAEPLGALAQFCLLVGDAYGDDVIVPAPGISPIRLPRGGGNDQLDRLVLPARLGVVQLAHAHQARALTMGPRLRGDNGG